MSPDRRDRELINAYGSGNLNEVQRAELEQRLRESPETRRLLCEYRGMESALRDSTAFPDSQSTGPPASAATIRRLRWAVGALTLVATLLLAALVATRGDGPPVIATMEGTSGVVQWTGDGGSVSLLELGDSITGGTVEAVSSDSAATIRYLDGSTLTLGSETIVIVSAGSQKRATIRSGSIAAAIQPQPEGKPFVIHTSTAKFEILGTRFEIDARTDTTCIQVNEGTVRATRKVDGAIVDVPALHSAVADLEAGRELRAIPRPEPAFEWTSQLEAGSKYTVGDWLPEEGEFKARLRATPFLFQKTGRPTQVVYRASIHLPFNEQRVIQLKPEALVVVRGWLESNAEVELMLSTRADGRFGGNFFYRSTPSVGERFEIRASVSAFVGAQGYESARVPCDAVLRKVVAITVGTDAGLQVESVELVLPGSAAVTMAGKTGSLER